MIDDKKIEAANEEIYEDRFLLNGEEVIFDNDAKEEMFYKEDIKEAIRVADIIFDNNNIWDKDKSETMNDYINIRCNIDNTFYDGFHNSALLDSISYMYNE